MYLKKLKKNLNIESLKKGKKKEKEKENKAIKQ